MFTVQKVDADRKVKYVDAEWDYRDARANWNRAFSFLPFWSKIWIRADKNGNVTIEYGS